MENLNELLKKKYITNEGKTLTLGEMDEVYLLHIHEVFISEAQRLEGIANWCFNHPNVYEDNIKFNELMDESKMFLKYANDVWEIIKNKNQNDAGATNDG